MVVPGGSECDEVGISDKDDNLVKKKTKKVAYHAVLSDTKLECLEKGCYVGFLKI